MKKIILLCSVVVSLSTFAFEEAKDFSELGVNSIFSSSPVDDPSSYHVEEGEYEIKTSPFLWVVPGPGSERPEVVSQKSNNNVAIEFFDNRIFLAFRTGPTHFASKKTRMYVISSVDGMNWDLEWKSEGGHDAREPQLISYKGRLHFYHFTAGTSPFSFKPGRILRTTRSGFQNWSTPEEMLESGEVHWEMKVREGVIWMTSYHGAHYRLRGGEAKIKLMLKKSTDGRTFVPQDPTKEFVYMGGASEAGFEFDDEGNLYAVTRNEDGDMTGFGAHMVFAPSYYLSYWSMRSVAESFQSPRMFRHGKDIYLIARRHKGKRPFGWAGRGGYAWRRIMNWGRWSLTPKTTALYKMNQDRPALEHVMDLPGAGDTAFPSVRRVDKHTFLVANYTSSLKKQNRRWIMGQLGRTQIYLMALKFEKKN